MALFQPKMRIRIFDMKSAPVQQIAQQWPQISRWLAAGEEVEVTEQDAVVAKLVPVAKQPDFLARAKAIWGDKPQGKPLSEIVSESRGN
jgi:antitoxin (DNA-binding transcriptional repressor) of toxin-antitoxin stability system